MNLFLILDISIYRSTLLLKFFISFGRIANLLSLPGNLLLTVKCFSINVTPRGKEITELKISGE